MKRSMTIIKIGYNNLCFENADDAIEVYKLISCSVPIDSNYGALPDGRKGISWVRESDLSISLNRVDEKIIELRHTMAEMKERAEAKNDIDIDAEVTTTDEMIAITHAPKLLASEDEVDFF